MASTSEAGSATAAHCHHEIHIGYPVVQNGNTLSIGRDTSKTAKNPLDYLPKNYDIYPGANTPT